MSDLGQGCRWAVARTFCAWLAIAWLIVSGAPVPGAVVSVPENAPPKTPTDVASPAVEKNEVAKDDGSLERKDEPSDATHEAKADDRQGKGQRDALFLLLLQVLRSPK